MRPASIHDSGEAWTWRSIVLPILFSTIAIVFAVGLVVIAALVAPAFK